MDDDRTTASAGQVERHVRPALLTEKELLAIVDSLIRDAAYNRPAAVAIGMAVGAAVEAELSARMAVELKAVRKAERERCADFCRATADDYRKLNRSGRYEDYQMVRFAAYAVALDDIAAEIEKRA